MRGEEGGRREIGGRKGGRREKRERERRERERREGAREEEERREGGREEGGREGGGRKGGRREGERGREVSYMYCSLDRFCDGLSKCHFWFASDAGTVVLCTHSLGVCVEGGGGEEGESLSTKRRPHSTC